MSRIANALKIARGETAELGLRALEGTNGGPAARRVLRDSQTNGGDGSQTAGGTDAFETQAPEVAWSALPRYSLSLAVSQTSPLLASKRDQPYAAEQYRVVRTRILQSASKRSVIVVSSPGIGDGKTVTAVNLAAAFAMDTEERVLLVDADLRRSSVHSYLNVPESPGLADVLAGACEVQDAAFGLDQIPGLWVLPAGKPAASPTELLGSSRWPALIKTLRQNFQRVILDCPPVEAVADYDLIATLCDGVILIVRPDCTDRTLCLRAIEKAKAKSLGVLINGTEERAASKRYFARYYSRQKKGEGIR
jgi:capsular exopolysaccharide synthesis family protein